MKAFHVNRKQFVEIFKESGKYSMKLYQNAVATLPLVNSQKLSLQGTARVTRWRLRENNF